jgi:hypothetical protein
MLSELDIATVDGHVDSVSLGGGCAGRVSQRYLS